MEHAGVLLVLPSLPHMRAPDVLDTLSSVEAYVIRAIAYYSPTNRFPASDPRFHKYEHHLSPGWVPGRQIASSPPL